MREDAAVNNNRHFLEIARLLKIGLLDNQAFDNEFSVFLCGGSNEPQDRFRRALGNRLEGLQSKFRYSVIYAEDMLEELIAGPGREDLIYLEKVLAEAVAAIVILLQSAGTMVELGAFASFRELRQKLIVIIDPKYKKDRSFVSYGPIKLIKGCGPKRVIYRKMSLERVEELAELVSAGVRSFPREHRSVGKLDNPISSHDFYLSMIHVFGPVPTRDLIGMVKALTDGDERMIEIVTQCVINWHIRSHLVSSKDDRLSITKEGLEYLAHRYPGRNLRGRGPKGLDELRLDALNLTLRKRFKWLEDREKAA